MRRCSLTHLLPLIIAVLLTPFGVAVGQPSALTPTFKIGVIIPLTGSLADYGNALKNGISLAQEHFPHHFKDIKVVIEDYHSDPKSAVSAYQKLVSIDKVNAVYVWGATPTEAIAPLAQGQKIPLIAMSLNDTSAKGRSYVFRTIPTADEVVLPLAQHIASLWREGKIHSLHILKTEWVYTETLAQTLKHLLPNEIEVEESSYQRDETDFKGAVARLRTSRSNSIAVLLGTGQIRTFFRQLGNYASNYTIFGDDFFGSTDEIEKSGSGIQGSVFSHIGSCDAFDTKYAGRFGSLSQVFHAVNAYDVMTLLAETASGVSTPDEFLSALRLKRSFKGICDSFEITGSAEHGQYFKYPMVLYQVEGLKARRVS